MVAERICLWCSIFLYYLESVSSISVYWNVPTRVCIKRGIDLGLSRYGIRTNADERFYGNEVVTFYEGKIGLYPLYNVNQNATYIINRGLPQLVDLDKHLWKAEKDIVKAIPNQKFSGLAILDFEAWRPKYSLNWSSKSIYRKISRRIVAARNNSLDDAEVERIAEMEFDKAAYNFMVETIKLGKKLRPNGKWGFYGFPLCNYDAGQNNEDICKDKFKAHNNNLLEILNEVDALYPSIYLKGNRTAEANQRYVKAVLTESKRVASQLNDTKKPIYAYSSFEYTYSVPNKPAFYSESDLSNTLKQMKDMGINGTVVWSASKNLKNNCELMKTYLYKTYGLYLSNLLEQNFHRRLISTLLSFFGL